MNSDLVLVNSGFCTRKSFNENYPKFGHALSENFAQPCPRANTFTEYRFEGAPNY